MDWKCIEDEMPAPGISVLAYYLNSNGKSRIVKAAWIPAGFEESDDYEFGEYDADKDQYFFPEGWYEQIDNWGDYQAVAINEGNVSHWMPLPAPPVVVGLWSLFMGSPPPGHSR